MLSNCNNCVEKNCTECLIERICSVSKDTIIVQPQSIQPHEEDYTVALTLR